MVVRVRDEIRVAIDVGAKTHHVGIGSTDGRVLDEFEITHNAMGFAQFFKNVELWKDKLRLPVVVAMEGLNGWARPLDRMILDRYELLNVNNVKLARFKEIFPGPAKNDPIDTRKMLELMHMRVTLPMAKAVLHRVVQAPVENEQLKRLTRRRNQLVDDKIRLLNRLQSDLYAVSPGLLEITGEADNLWFLHFITAREDLTKLSRMRRSGLLEVRGVGKVYAAKIEEWQSHAIFSNDVAWVGPMIIADAQGVIDLKRQIQALDTQIEQIASTSEIACRLRTIPGFGPTTSATLAGELGTLDRFESEASLALYSGMTRLDNSSGQYVGSKNTRQVNTHAKAAMMVAIARHTKQVPESKAYYEKKRAEGKTHNQAIRALGRHMIRVIWSMIQQQRDYSVKP